MTCVNMCMGCGPDIVIDCMGCAMPTGMMSEMMQKIGQTMGMETSMDMMMKMCKIIKKGGRMALMGDCYTDHFPMGKNSYSLFPLSYSFSLSFFFFMQGKFSNLVQG